MKKYPSYIDSLISELHSSDIANNILQRYMKYSTDPILSQLFETFSQSPKELIHSATALELIHSVLMEKGLKDTLAATYYEYHIDELVSREDIGISCKSLIKECSLSSLWGAPAQSLSTHKTLKQLSFEVKQFVVEKGNCTYREVADMVASRDNSNNERNIRRRVYDVINVLTAAKILEKKGKQVCAVERDGRAGRRVNGKKEILRKVAMEYQKLCGIVRRNMGCPNCREAIRIPFLVLITKKNVKFM